LEIATLDVPLNLDGNSKMHSMLISPHAEPKPFGGRETCQYCQSQP
jgi:hypothetical protein